MISYGPGLVFPDAWGGRPEEELEEPCEVCGGEPTYACGLVECPTGMWADGCPVCGDPDCMEDTHG